MEEGVFYEALNIAKLWQLPMIFWISNYKFGLQGVGGCQSRPTWLRWLSP
jgi:TPP-dependent pyruvate/acetoin dehydrogenase alpha subunit